MAQLSRRKAKALSPRQASVPTRQGRGGQHMIIDGYAPSQMIEDLRKYQAELEIQNKALRYSQQEAEGASERFATLFSNVPLALMVVDEEGLVLASNAMALRLFQPLESDAPLNFLLPFVGPDHTDEVAVAFSSAKQEGTSEVHEVAFLAGSRGKFTGDLHIARIENPLDELAHFICAIIDQGPLLAERQALQESADVLRQRNEDLLLSENRMAAIINSSLDAILCIDEKQCITVFNPAATTLFECPADQAFGARLGRFLPDVERALENGSVPAQAMLGEFTATTLSGRQIYVEISVSLERRLRTRASLRPLDSDPTARRGQHGAHGTVTTIFARDLTAKKLAEAQRTALETQLRESPSGGFLRPGRQPSPRAGLSAIWPVRWRSFPLLPLRRWLRSASSACSVSGPWCTGWSSTSCRRWFGLAGALAACCRTFPSSRSRFFACMPKTVIRCWGFPTGVAS